MTQTKKNINTSTHQHINTTLIPFTNLKSQYQTIKPEIDRAIESVFEDGQFIGGKFVEKFESDFAALQGSKNCISVGNGTDAIFVALKCLGLLPGDEVITAAFGWLSAAEMITAAGGTVVFCDVTSECIIDPAQIEQKITPRTKGIIIVHLYGQAAHAEEIKRICGKHSLFLIEDCAQAHLTAEFDQSVGTIGNVGAFSFYPTKNLGACGDGGCILTQDQSLAEKMRLFANHGGLHQHAIEGINSRLDSLQAAILSVKCSYLLRWTDQRIKHASQYNFLLKDIHQITLPVVRSDTKHSFHQYVIRSQQRDALKDYLKEHGIQTLIHYPVALHNLPAYRRLHFKPEDFPEATRCQEEVLSLPMYPELLPQQISFVCEKIEAFFKTQ